MTEEDEVEEIVSFRRRPVMREGVDVEEFERMQGGFPHKAHRLLERSAGREIWDIPAGEEVGEIDEEYLRDTTDLASLGVEVLSRYPSEEYYDLVKQHQKNFDSADPFEEVHQRLSVYRGDKRAIDVLLEDAPEEVLDENDWEDTDHFMNTVESLSSVMGDYFGLEQETGIDPESNAYEEHKRGAVRRAMDVETTLFDIQRLGY